MCAMLDLNRIQSIEQEWASIEDSYRLAPYNAPLNREEERQKTFDAYRESQSYNPQFVYATPPVYPLERIQSFVVGLGSEHSPIEALYYEIAHNELLAIQRIQTHSPGIITGASCLAYGLPDRDLLAQARSILETIPPTDIISSDNLSAEQASLWIQSYLGQMGIQGWKAVVFEPMNAKMAVARLDKEIKIRKGTTFSQDALRRLLVHEIGVHVLRYENGANQPIRLFRNGFTGYLDTEEGLAVHNEEQTGLLEMQTLRKYAGRVIAAHLALSDSFANVFEALVDDLGLDTAFNITVRAKRGFRDTAQPGAHTKDIVYLRGYLRVKAHLEKHPDDHALLFTGKIGLQHISLVRSLMEEGIIVLPAMLPEHIIELLNKGQNEFHAIIS